MQHLTYLTTYYIHTGEEGIVIIITILKGPVPQNHVGITLPQKKLQKVAGASFFFASLGGTPLQGMVYSQNFNIFKAKGVHIPNHSTTKRTKSAPIFSTTTKCFSWLSLATSPTAAATLAHEAEEEIRQAE